MKRMSLFLDEKILRKLRREADRQKVSAASLVRAAISSYLGEPGEDRHLPSVTGTFSSGKRNTPARIDHLLWRDPHV